MDLVHAPVVDSRVFGEMVGILMKQRGPRVLLDLHWRHHALGMLQAELSESVRIHVWHPSLVRFPMGSPRAIHDHRFDLLSYIAIGRLVDVHYYVSLGDGALPPRKPGWINDPSEWTKSKLWQIRHAKVQAHDKSDFTALGDCHYRRGSMRTYMEGETYRIPRQAFHTTLMPELAVTFVYRSNFGTESARVLGELESAQDGHEVVTGIIRSTSAEEIFRYTLAAVEALGKRFL